MMQAKNIVMGAKDSKGRVTQVNDLLVKELGYQSQKDILNRSEYDVAREVFSTTLCSTDSLVDQYLSEDAQVFKGKELQQFYVQNWRGKLQFRIGYKYPQKNSRGKIIAAVHTSYEILKPTKSQIEHFLSLEEKGVVISNQSKSHIQWYLKELEREFPLTSRELACVKYLIQGKSAKEIAQVLNLSHRTIEFYIDNAKTKLNCVNRYELIAKCFYEKWIDIPEILS